MRKRAIISLILGVFILTAVLECDSQNLVFGIQITTETSLVSSPITPFLSPSPTNTPIPSPTPTNTPTPTPSPIPTPTPSPTLPPLNPASYSPLADAIPSTLIRTGDESKKEIALTFDDQGPFLADILTIIDKRNIKASFFLISSEIEKNSRLWTDAIANGHHVLNHTVSHNVRLFAQSYEYMYKEIMGWETVARKVLGDEYVDLMKKDFPLFRTPGGGKSDKLHKTLGDLGYSVTAYWSCEDVYFQRHNSKKISLTEHYVRCARNGAIFLMHPGTGKYLEEIIGKIEEKGFEFKLLADMITFPSAE